MTKQRKKVGRSNEGVNCIIMLIEFKLHSYCCVKVNASNVLGEICLMISFEITLSDFLLSFEYNCFSTEVEMQLFVQKAKD